MANLKELTKNFNFTVTGFVKSLDEYVSKKDPKNPKSYWSVSIDGGGEVPLKISIPDGYDKSMFQPWEIVTCLFTTKHDKFQNQTTFVLV